MEALGRDVWLMILSLLDVQSLCCVRRVCKFLMSVASYKPLWDGKVIKILPPPDNTAYYARHPAVGSKASINTFYLPVQYSYICVPFIKAGNDIWYFKETSRVCEVCGKINEFNKCVKCNEIACNCNIIKADNIPYCVDCAQHYILSCPTCKGWYKEIDDSCDVCEEIMCESCLDNRLETHPKCYTACKRCTAVKPTNVSIHCNKCGDEICEDCDESDNRRFHLCEDCYYGY